MPPKSHEELEDEGPRTVDESPPQPPAKPARKLKVPKFLTDQQPVEQPPNPATTFRGHEQPSVNERLEQIKIFLGDEDANRCLDFKDKLKQIQDYLTHVEKHNLPRDWKLFKDAKVMTDIQADWHDRMDRSDLGDPLCVDTPQIQPYSTRLMSNEVTLAIRETKEINGTQIQVREDRPPFTVKRTKDHPVFLRALKEDAKKTLTDLTEEEENRNLFKIEGRAYHEAKEQPSLIPLWTDPIRGLPDTGKSTSSADPWYGSGQVLGVTPKTEVKQEPMHNELPRAVMKLQEAVRYALETYRENVIHFGRGDQRHAKDWHVAVLKAVLRLFPTPEAKALERNANVYSTGQRRGDITNEEYRVIKEDWKKYNDLQDQLLEHLSAKTTPPITFYFDEPDMVKTDIYDPTKINIPRQYGERMREVDEMQQELRGLLIECRDSGGPQSCKWFMLGRMAEILAPAEPDIFGEVGKLWSQLKTRHIPLLWDKAFRENSKHNWLSNLDAKEREVVDNYIEKLRDLWDGIFKENPELQREGAILDSDDPWVVLLPLQKGALRTDPVRHDMSPDFLQPYIFYIPWATPHPELSGLLKDQVTRIHRILKRKSEEGNQLSPEYMATLRQNLAPFYYPRLRRMYDQTLSDDPRVRGPALKAFADIFEPWLAGFEGVGVEIRNYKPEDIQPLLKKTIPAVLVNAKDEKAPQFRQRDPSVLYQTHKRLDPNALNTLNAELNRDVPDPDARGADEGFTSEARRKYAELISNPTLEQMKEQLAHIEKEIEDLGGENHPSAWSLNLERRLLKRKFSEEGKRNLRAVRAGAKAKLKDKTITVLQSVDFVGTDVDTDNTPGVFYLATEPPSPRTIHPTKVDPLSLVPNLDTGLYRNREQNWQQFILGYPKQTSRYDTGTLNFQSKAERRGIQRAAIEMALNLLASNYEQRRQDDRFRRVVIPSPWQPPLPEVPISMELEPTKRPVELDPKYYTNLMVEYNRWKDDDWYDAREKIIKVLPGDVPPPINYNGPFTIPRMHECQDRAAKYLGSLAPTWNALIHAATNFPRPFLTALLARIERGVNFVWEVGDRLYEGPDGWEVRLAPQELAALREFTEPAWNCHWEPYPPIEDEAEDIPRQILEELERDIDALPESQKPPYWSSGRGPNPPPGGQTVEQRDIRTIIEYEPRVPSVTFITLKDLLESINARRRSENLPTWDLETARAHLRMMHQYHHMHFEHATIQQIEDGLDQEGSVDHVARVPLTGVPEMKYIEHRIRSHMAYGFQWDRPANICTVQYNASRFSGPPILQPNLYTFIEKAAFKFGRAIISCTQELTWDETNYPADRCLAATKLSYRNTLTRLEGKPLYTGEPNVPPAAPNPNNITLIRIASDLHKVAPDIFSDYGLNPETLTDPSVPSEIRNKYAALVVQTQVIEELNNNWESRFPIQEKVWEFARDRLVNPVRTKVAGRVFTEYHQPRQYFSMRRWPPCEQRLASQKVIADSGPVVQKKIVKEVKPIKTNAEKKIELLKKKREPTHIGGGAAPNFPFGETPYQQAYLSWRMTEDLKDVPEFNPPPRPRKGLLKFLPAPPPPPPVDHYALPDIPSSFRPRSIPFETLRQRTISAAQSTPGLPSLTEYYRDDAEARRVREYKEWKRQNERIRKIEELAKGKSWQNMTREEREKWEGELAIIEMEEQRALQNAGGSDGNRGRDRRGGGLDARGRGLALRTGQSARKRSRSRSRSRSSSRGGREGRSKRRSNRPSPIQVPVMSGGL